MKVGTTEIVKTGDETGENGDNADSSGGGGGGGGGSGGGGGVVVSQGEVMLVEVVSVTS